MSMRDKELQAAVREARAIRAGKEAIQEKRIKSLLAEGLTANAIAKRVGVSVSRVRRIRDEAGMEAV